MFRREISRVHRGLKNLFRTDGEVAVLASSGTGAMEAAVANVVTRGDPVVVIRSGKYGERWGEICGAYGAKVDWLEVEPGAVVDPGELGDRLDSGGAKAVFAVHLETSTGALNDIAGVARAVGDCSTLVVDAISSLGVHEFDMDGWGVDVAVGASQKGLALPPGLGFVAVGPGARARVESSGSPRYYFDLRKYLTAGAENQTPFTAPVTLIAALGRALENLGTTDESIARHARLSRAFRAGVEAMNLEMFPAVPSNAVTVFAVPEHLDAEELVRILEEDWGMRIAAGQGALRNRVVRMGHLGHISDEDVVALFEALEKVLPQCGHPVEPGRGVRAVGMTLARSGEESHHGS
jgi:aspartate aminotransferase-like enzyme